MTEIGQEWTFAISATIFSEPIGFRRFTSATERETRLVLRGRSPTITAIDAATFRLGLDVALVHV